MREARTSLTVATILVLLGGSSGVATAEAGVGTVSLSAGCDKPIVESGDYEGVNDVGDDAERYWVVVPESYGQNAPLPLVLWLSSGGGFVDSNYAGWRPYLDDIDVLFAVASTETERSLETDTMLALLDRLEADFCIDLRRIHVMGESSSSGAVGRLACAGSQRIASFLGGMGGFDAPGCVPERPVPLFALTGDQDRWIVAPSVERWATANGCDADPLVEDLGSGVSRSTYRGCDGDVVFYDIEGVGHAFIFHECIGPAAGFCRAYAEVDQLDDALEFFEQHPMPE
jgi:poly(3-hydroxybutyrate) depolymerase